MSRLSVTISLCFAFIVLTLIDGTKGDFCPYDYGFTSCPRPFDIYTQSTCCRINGIPSCCDASVLAAWAIGVVVMACFLISFVFLLVVCACCPCCWLANRRQRRSHYTVVSNEAAVAYPSTTTRTTYVYNASYPAGQPNYSSTGYHQPTAPPMGAPPPPNTYIKQ